MYWYGKESKWTENFANKNYVSKNTKLHRSGFAFNNTNNNF